MRYKNFRLKLLDFLLAFSLISAPNFVWAQNHALDDRVFLIDQIRAESTGNVEIKHHNLTGTVRFIGTEPGEHIKNPAPLAALRGVSPEGAAISFLDVYGSLFGIKDQSTELSVMKSRETDRGRSFVRFQQHHQGIPVMAGELIVQTDSAMDIVSAHGKTIPDISIDINPVIDAVTAREIALDAVSIWHNEDMGNLSSTEPQVWIYNPVVFGINENINYLVWRMDVGTVELKPISELVLVNAHTGKIVLHFNQIENGLHRKVYDNQNDVNAGLPGYGPVREEGGGPTGIADVDHAYDYVGDAYNFYWTYHGRDSIDGAGMAILFTARYCRPGETCPYNNAFWAWDLKQMAFGEGFALADDVVGHELTHGVTQFESGLAYYMQPGAINESFSDIWGEFIDLTNGKGNDFPSVRWLTGEDLPGGAIRSMKDPTLYGDPDRMGHPNYHCDTSDNGGVHSNSGVGNKAVTLLVDGGTFNGYTVNGIGLTKTAKIFYEVQTNLLTSGSDYADLFDALYQGCLNLVGTAGITLSDCQQVKKAGLATEMNLPPLSCPSSDAPLCDAGDPSNFFFDNMEDPLSGNWGHGPVSGTLDGWHNPNQGYATSGVYSLWGESLDTASDYAVTMSHFVQLPPGKTSYMHFNHAYDFELKNGPTDGGVLEYQVFLEGGWQDAWIPLTHNGYNGVIKPGTSNPLSGRLGFTGKSNGYISSRLNLSMLAGKAVRFRFRIGNDGSNDPYNRRPGWYIDDVRIYTCETASCSYSISPSSQSVSEMGGLATVSVTTQSGCHWTANSHAPWINTPSDVMTGSYTMNFKVEANPSTASRGGSATVAGQAFNVYQPGVTGVTIGEAVDNTLLTWTTGGNKNWFGRKSSSYYGGDAAQSGPIGDGESSWVQTNVAGPATLSFYWKVSSEFYSDYLTFYMEGVEKDKISGEVDWQQMTYSLPSGSHIIRWEYKKDGGYADGFDAGWLDLVEIANCSHMTSTNMSFPASGGTGSVNVTASAGCGWWAASNASWIWITSGQSGNGSGTVNYKVEVNTSTSPRTGTITIDGEETFTINQSGMTPIALGEALDNTTLTWTTGGSANWFGQPFVSYIGGDAAQSGDITHNQTSWLQTSVTGPVDVSFYWKVSSEPNGDYLRFSIDSVEKTKISGVPDWVQVVYSVPSGSHTLRWAFTRNATVGAGSDCGWVDGVQVIPCSYAIAPSSAHFTASAGTGSVNVTSSSVCSWTATRSTEYNWITITSGSTGTGNGTVNFSVSANPTVNPRTGYMTIAGKTFVVNQDGISCTYSISKSGQPFSSDGGWDTVTITTTLGCNWSAGSNDPSWITITTGTDYTGTFPVTYYVYANPEITPRAGTMRIASFTFTVTQAGSSCNYSLSPKGQSFPVPGGTGTINVAAQTGCGWAAESDASWIAITSGSSGNGNGTVSYSASANPGADTRSGTITSAGQMFLVLQAGNAQELSVELPKTGQTASYASGDDGDSTLQAGVPWPDPRFMDLDGTLPIVGDLILDHLTGLVWTRDANSPGPDCSPGIAKTWQQGLDHVACLNTHNYLGHDDWRLPNVNELESLVHAGEMDLVAWLEAQDFAGIQKNVYWTSTTHAVNTNNALTVDLWGYVDAFNKNSSYSVWPVRGTTSGPSQLAKTGQVTGYDAARDGEDGDLQKGVPWPMPRFTVSGDCVTDHLTGLMWLKETGRSQFTWQQALDHANGLTPCGHSDWRLPNRKELRSLVNYWESNSATWLNGEGFENMKGEGYWSSTTYAAGTSMAWFVNLWFGSLSAYSKTNNLYVLPVRGGIVGNPNILLSPATFDFGVVDVDTSSSPQPFTISNNGSADLVITSIEVTAGDASMFSVATGGSSPCPSLTPVIPTGSNCTIALSFLPAWADLRSTTLRIFSDDPDTPVLDTALSGTGRSTLTVIKTGRGFGTVMSDPPGISCGSDCTEQHTTVTDVRLTTSANPGSAFTGWTGGGCSGAGTCTVTMDTNKEVIATFILAYTITATTGSGGKIVPSGNVIVNLGADQTFGIEPDPGHHIVDVVVDTISQGPITSYTFTNVTGNHAISATFAINTYTISTTAGGGGKITPSGGVTVNYGADQTFGIEPDPGHHIVDVVVDTISQGPVASYTFTNVTSNHAISATFAINTYTISTTAGSGGKITPSGGVTVNYGADQTFGIEPDPGYHVVDVVVDTISQGPIASYTFTNVTSNHAISATFDINTYTISITAGSGGKVAPSGSVTVDHGNNQTFGIEPNLGYHILDVLVDGESKGPITSYTFSNVTANHTIEASFETNTFLIDPLQGTLGTEITLTGRDFGIKKGRVLIGSASLKVLEWNVGEIRCSLTKALPPENYPITVVPKGTDPITNVVEPFTVKFPKIDDGKYAGSIGEEITLQGYFFGTKKGKLYVGSKSCKVTLWEMNLTTGKSTIKFIVPKGLVPGPYDVKVSNKVGEDILSGSFSVE